MRKVWNWKKIDAEHKNYNDFEVTLGEFGNHGIARTVDVTIGDHQTEHPDNKDNESDHVVADDNIPKFHQRCTTKYNHQRNCIFKCLSLDCIKSFPEFV